MKHITLIAMVLMAGMAFGQDATVVELSKSDADQAKQLYEAKQAADKAWDEAYSKIVGKYQGFSGGATFSKDFRFIVPKASAIITAPNCWGSAYYSGSGIFDINPISITPSSADTTMGGDSYFRTAPSINSVQ